MMQLIKDSHENNQNIVIKITSWKIILSILATLYSYSLLIYYTYAYTTIRNTDLESMSLSMCFLCYLILGWVYTSSNCTDLYYMFQYHNRSMPKRTWDSILPSNKFPLLALRIIPWVTNCLGIYFVTNFIPYNIGCNIYSGDDAYHMCAAMRLISFNIMILITVLCIAVVILIFVGFVHYFCKPDIINDDDLNDNPIITDNIFSGLRDQILSRLPISNEPPNSGICALCLADAVEGDQWRTLNCDHKFHPLCIDPWLQQKPTCPLCRRFQTMTDVADQIGITGPVGIRNPLTQYNYQGNIV